MYVCVHACTIHIIDMHVCIYVCNMYVLRIRLCMYTCTFFEPFFARPHENVHVCANMYMYMIAHMMFIYIHRMMCTHTYMTSAYIPIHMQK
jgi:hypothetical protein